MPFFLKNCFIYAVLARLLLLIVLFQGWIYGKRERDISGNQSSIGHMTHQKSNGILKVQQNPFFFFSKLHFLLCSLQKIGSHGFNSAKTITLSVLELVLELSRAAFECLLDVIHQFSRWPACRYLASTTVTSLLFCWFSSGPLFSQLRTRALKLAPKKNRLWFAGNFQEVATHSLSDIFVGSKLTIRTRAVNNRNSLGSMESQWDYAGQRKYGQTFSRYTASRESLKKSGLAWDIFM